MIICKLCTITITEENNSGLFHSKQLRWPGARFKINTIFPGTGIPITQHWDMRQGQISQWQDDDDRIISIKVTTVSPTIFIMGFSILALTHQYSETIFIIIMGTPILERWDLYTETGTASLKLKPLITLRKQPQSFQKCYTIFTLYKQYINRSYPELLKWFPGFTFPTHWPLV